MPWPDWFGSKTLKKLAGDDAPEPKPKGDAGIDIAKMAQDQADQAAKDKAKADAAKKKKPNSATIGDLMQGTPK